MAPSRQQPSGPSAPRCSRRCFKWSRDHRQMLMVCHRLELFVDQIQTIFNDMYRPDCEKYGMSDGIGLQALRSQYDKSYRIKSKSWNEVETTTTESEVEAMREQIRSRLHNSPGITVSQSQTSLRPASSASPGVPYSRAVQHPRLSSVSVSRTRRPQRAGPVSYNETDTETMVEFEATTSNEDMPVRNRSQVVRKRYAQDKYISPNRTRTVSGEQVPMCNAIGPDRIDNNPVTPEEAHNCIPELVFRFYTGESQGVNSRVNGFLAGYHKFLTIQSTAAPRCDDGRLYIDMLNHLNCIRQASPLISTTSSLFFALRQAAKTYSSDVRISVIRGSALLPEKRIYHVKPYRDRMTERKEFFGGTMTVPGSHEYLVWAKIHPAFILHDFALKDLERHISGDPVIYNALRFGEWTSKLNNAALQTSWRHQKVVLDLPLTVGLANFLRFAGVSTQGPTIIALLVSEFIRGWEIALNISTETQWEMFADAFVYTLVGHENHKTLSGEDIVRIKEAFRCGLFTGLGKVNWHLKTADQEAMIRRAAKVGLNPGQSTMNHRPLQIRPRQRQMLPETAPRNSRRDDVYVVIENVRDTIVVNASNREDISFDNEANNEDEEHSVYALSDEEEESSYEN